MLSEFVVEVQLDWFYFITCISLPKCNIGEKKQSPGIKNQSSEYY